MAYHENIYDVSKMLDIDDKYVIPYGKNKAKISYDLYEEIKDRKDGKLVLVTAITPTKAGEGKTTTSIALHDGLAAINQKSLLCLREPSLGPVFGIKGGATGGGKASLTPSEEINLHFTGDMHALTSAINLISAVIDNHIYQGNELNIDPNQIVWHRALDMNDRALRSVTVMQNDKKGIPHQEQFVITVASEMMAILCLATSKEDFINRINNIIVAYDKTNNPIYLRQLKISHAVYRLLKEALNPNLVQTLEGNPCFVHGGPFANIAHGCNSLLATKLALKLSPIVVTEAGFGADLGAEKFFDIKCRVGNLKPDLVVMVATIRALKLHGGVLFEDLAKENVDAMLVGCANLKQHLENISKFGLDFVVCINHFDIDSDNETKALEDWCKQHNYKYAFCDSFKNGSKGGTNLANEVIKALNQNKSQFHYLYDEKDAICAKIEKICKEIYRAGEIEYSEVSKKQIEKFEKMGYGQTPICIAKTPQSFSDNAKLLNTPKNFKITIREVNLSSGANFVVPLLGNIMTMPVLLKVPSEVNMEDEPI